MKGNLNPGFVTVDGAARLVGVTHWTVRKWLQTKRLTRYKTGQHTVVSRAELLELLKPKRIEDHA